MKELGKLTPYVRNKGALLAREGAEKRLWELFIKNTALCKHESGRILCDACPVLERQRSWLAQAKLASEAPVNGGRNSDGPKVAKFLVG